MATEGHSGGESMPSSGDAAPQAWGAFESSVPPHAMSNQSGEKDGSQPPRQQRKRKVGEISDKSEPSTCKRGKDRAYRDRKKEDLQKVKAENVQLKSDLERVRNDLERVTNEKKHAVLEAEIRELRLRNELTEARKDKELSDCKNESLQKELQSANQRVQDISAQLQSTNQREQEISSQLQSANAQLQSANAQVQHLIQGYGISTSRCKAGRRYLPIILQRSKTFLSPSSCRSFQCEEIFTSPNSSANGETFLNSISSKLRFTDRGNKKLLISMTLTNNEVNRMLTVPIGKSGIMSSLQCVLNSISSSNIPLSRNTTTEMDAERKLSVRKAILPSHLPFSISQMSILQGYLEPLRNMDDLDILVVSAWSVCKSPCARIMPNLVIFGEKSWMGSLLYSALHHGTNMNPAMTTRQDGTVGQGELLKLGVKDTDRIYNRKRLDLKPFDKQLMKEERTLQRKEAKAAEVRAETNRMEEEAVEMVEAMEEKEAELTGPNGTAETRKELLKVRGEETGRRKRRKSLNLELRKNKKTYQKMKAKLASDRAGTDRLKGETAAMVEATDKVKAQLALLRLHLSEMVHTSEVMGQLMEIGFL